ncbi:MAG: DUF5711 family protein [Lachnospiraceae bacterium]|nr:DUF5711 family protein [Lachnospiraceae bacterium]
MAGLRAIKGGRYDEEQPGDYRTKLKRHKAMNAYRTIIFIVLILVIVLIIYARFESHVYTGYEILSSYERIAPDSQSDLRLGHSILTYSHDGAHCVDANGKTVWDQGYEMQDIRISVCEGTVAIASYNGRDIYVLNETEKLGSFSTNLPIREVAVAATGRVTAVLNADNATLINTYSPTGDLLYSGQMHMSGSGYPVDIALNPSGTLLCVSFIYVDAGTVKSTVAFYNLTEVGDNYTDFLVSSYDYTDLVVPDVGFLDDSTAYAVGDERYMFYKGSDQPESIGEHLISDEIRSVFAGNGYLGIVFRSDDTDVKYELSVYGNSDNLVGKYDINFEYTDVLFEKDDLVIYNESSCIIYTYRGREKFNDSFRNGVRLIIPTDNAYRYVLSTNSSIDIVRLN